jgi:CheY-like chemotaxis protein
MNQALVVDRKGEVGDFAASALRGREYELTIVDSLQLALALVSAAPYQLIIIAQPELCADVLWRMVASIKRLSADSTPILVQAQNADKDFYVHARQHGAVVLHMPLDVAARTAIQEATIG